MIWSLETDDFLGKCYGFKYPLLTAINSVLCGGVTVSTKKTKSDSNIFITPVVHVDQQIKPLQPVNMIVQAVMLLT
jgi:hypothetical protein